VINIFFVPGTFGSTIEYVLRSHTKEYSIDPINVSDDGSMHAMPWLSHHNSLRGLKNYFEDYKNPNDIVTTGYPLHDASLSKILTESKKYITDQDRNILIYCDGTDFAEQNLLFLYHKLVVGKVVQIGLVALTSNVKHDFSGWNANYKTWKDLQPWEFREWFSLYYPKLLLDWTNGASLVDNSFLSVSGNDILHNTLPTFLKIINFCNLTIKTDLTAFVEEWQGKQQYILQEYKTVCTIVDCTIKKQPYTWSNLNIIAESIVQQRLRQQGYEIKCDGLNVFPTNSLDLHALLESNWRTE